MRNLLFIDTETTGFKKSGLIVDGQARVCQLALILTDEFGKTLMEFSSLIRPDKCWSISDGAQKVHGHTDKKCQDLGLSAGQVFYVYRHMSNRAMKNIAHNVVFDKGMLEVEAAYQGEGEEQTEWFCTMKANSGLSGGKSLANYYNHYIGKKIENAHDAMADTRACKDVYFEMSKRAGRLL